MTSAHAGNPFSPTFGTTPPVLAGRGDVLARFDDALDTGPTHPDYTLLITGDRGIGKTALLNALEAKAAQRGWLTIASTASSEPVAVRLATEAQRSIELIRAGSLRAHVSSVSVLGVGVSLQPHPAGASPQRSLLSVLEELGDLLRQQGAGVLLTVDEMHDVERDDVRDVAAAVQIVTRRRLCPVAYAAASLPLIEHTHLADANMTFLQRCARAQLGLLDEDETRLALRLPIVDRGGEINDDALAEAVEATLGYPYTIQLVGYHAWRFRKDADAPISLIDVRAAAAEADRQMLAQIAAPIWNRLSEMDRRFLAAMLPDEPDSSLDDIAQRLRRTLQYARTYRRRLTAAGAISPTSRARVAFRHHALRARALDAVREDPALAEPPSRGAGEQT